MYTPSHEMLQKATNAHDTDEEGESIDGNKDKPLGETLEAERAT